MGDVSITTTMDTQQLVEQLETAATKMTSAIASGLSKSARVARRDAIRTLAKDIGRPASTFRDATPLIKRASPNNLRAEWTVKKKALGILPTGEFVPVRSALQGRFVGSTFRISGGGSQHLSIDKSFIMAGKGSGADSRGLLFIRTGPGKRDIHMVVAEMPSTGMAYDDNAPRKEWTKTAQAEVAKNVAANVDLTINGRSVAFDEGAD